MTKQPVTRLGELRHDAEIVCDRFDDCVVFYRDRLGLQPIAHWAGVVRLDGGGGRWLTLWRADPLDRHEPAGHGRHSGATFVVDDVAAVRARLGSQGVTFASAPCRQPWGAMMVNATDPDGRLVTLLQTRRQPRDWRDRPDQGDQVAAAG